MDERTLQELLRQNEHERLDFKFVYKLDGPDEIKNEAVKDIVALANAAGPRPTDYAYLVIGAHDKLNPDGGREWHDPLGSNLSAKRFLDIVNSACTPPVSLDYETVVLDGRTYGVVVLPPSASLHWLTKDLKAPGGFWRKHSVLIRVGEEVQVASPQDIKRMEAERSQWRPEQSFQIGEKPPLDPAGIERRSDRRVVYPASSCFDSWWDEFRADDRLRILVIHGPSGRGKSFAAKQLRRHIREQDERSLHFWLDCGYHIPRKESLLGLFAKALPEGERQPFMASFLEVSRAELPVAPDFLARLRPSGAPAWHCYLYLDDLDHTLEEIDRPASFIHHFLRSLWRLAELRVVVTSKTPEFEKTLEALLHADGESGDLRVMTAELAPLDPDDSEEYLRERGVLALVDRSDRNALVDATRGEPLYLRLIEDNLKAIEADASPGDPGERQAKFLREIIKRCKADADGAASQDPTEEDLCKDLKGLLLMRQLGRLQEATYEVALGLAVLTYGYGRLSPGDDRILRITSRQDPLERHLDRLRRYRIIPEAGSRIEMDAPLRIDLDAARDFLHDEGRSEDKAGRKRHHARVGEMHRDAAEAYSSRSLVEAKALAAWHHAQGNQYRRALELLAEISPEMEADFRFADLLQLRRAVQEGIVELLQDNHARAENEAQLAEIEYQGYDRCGLGEEAWQLAASVIEHYRGPSLSILEDHLCYREELKKEPEAGSTLDRYSHENPLAYAQANMMLAIIAFESRESSWPELARAGVEMWELLVRHGERILEFAEGKIGDDAFKASVLSNLGVFWNRGARFEEAKETYDRAAWTLDRLEQKIPGSKRLLRDRLRIAVNRSRTLFLAEDDGPEPALAALENLLSTSGADGTQEWLYGTVNNCYYLLALNRVADAEEKIRACDRYRNDKQGLADSWIFDYVSAVRAAVLLYQGEHELARDAFDRLSADSFAEYPRDRALMALNRCVADSTRLLREAGSDGHGKDRILSDWSRIRSDMSTSLASVKSEPIAAETVDYLLWAIPIELERLLEEQLSDELKAAEPPELTRRRTSQRFSLLMDGEPDGARRPLQRLPVMMRGALVLRSRPLAPLRTEWETARRQ
jgi:hypothetical protein